MSPPHEIETPLHTRPEKFENVALPISTVIRHENGTFRKRWRHDVITLTQFSSNTNPKWPVISDRCIFKFLQCSVNGTHLISGGVVFKFSEGVWTDPEYVHTFPGGILPVVSRPTARKRPSATVYATALLWKRRQVIMLHYDVKNISIVDRSSCYTTM